MNRMGTEEARALQSAREHRRFERALDAVSKAFRKSSADKRDWVARRLPRQTAGTGVRAK